MNSTHFNSSSRILANRLLLLYSAGIHKLSLMFIDSGFRV